MSQIKFSRANNPNGDPFEVSTVRTLAGGAPVRREFIFSSEDYQDLNIWPFETMVFPIHSSKGLYHEPHETLVEAKERHLAIRKMIELGLEFPGLTVDSEFGNPTMTKEQWQAKLSQKVTK